MGILVSDSFPAGEAVCSFVCFQYNNAMNDVCYIISATVKISVALVLYRLVERVYSTIRWIIVLDIIACAIFNIATTLVLALGCLAGTPYTFSNAVCENTNYAQEASYVIWDVFHVVLPVFILWNIQMGSMVKSGVVGLFGVGLLCVTFIRSCFSFPFLVHLFCFPDHKSFMTNWNDRRRAAISTILRLRNYVEHFNPTPTTTKQHLWYTGVTWATTEHGLSLFAASILALKPVVQLVSRSWSSLSSSLSSSNRKMPSGGSASGGGFKNSNWALTPEGTELRDIGVRTEVSVDTKSKAQDRLQPPVYTAAAYNASQESFKRLVEGGKTSSRARDLV